MMPARQAAQTAEDARLIALQKQEEAFLAEQRAQAAAREQYARNRRARPKRHGAGRPSSTRRRPPRRS